MKPILRKRQRRQRRKRHVRKKVFGTPQRPRLTVFRSHKNIAAQIIDDTVGHTLVAASSYKRAAGDQASAGGGNREAARGIGAALAAKAIEAGMPKEKINTHTFV